MIFKDFVRKLLEEVPHEWWDENISIEEMSYSSRKTFLVDLDEYEGRRTVHIEGTDLPIEQFPYGVYGPGRKPYYWDEYKDLRARGLFPTGHEEM